MLNTRKLLSATRHLAWVLLAGLSLAAQGAALFTLSGDTDQVRQEGQGGIRISVLGWSEPEAAGGITSRYEEYVANQDHEAFATFLAEQDTKGYLFTQSATGYTIKYAWQGAAGLNDRMVFLVTPGLKTRNPYMWREPNESPAPFSLVELRFDGEEAEMKTSLDAAIEIGSGGNLQLRDFESSETFATLRDNTPYYLKNSG